jgi:hypothetical protein
VGLLAAHDLHPPRLEPQGERRAAPALVAVAGDALRASISENATVMG